jgi:Tfp pilus assembly protein FimV
MAAPRTIGWGGVLLLGLGLGMVLTGGAMAQPPDRPDDKRPDLEKARAEVKELEAHLEHLRAEMQATAEKLAQLRRRLAEAQGHGDDRVVLRLVGPDGKVQTIELPPGTKVLPGPGGPGGAPPPPGGPGGPERRDDLQRRVEELTRQLEELRRQLGRPPEGGPRDPRPMPPPPGRPNPG